MLAELIDDCLVIIYSFLEINDLVRLLSLSKRFSKSVIIWRSLFHRLRYYDLLEDFLCNTEDGENLCRVLHSSYLKWKNKETDKHCDYFSEEGKKQRKAASYQEFCNDQDMDILTDLVIYSIKTRNISLNKFFIDSYEKWRIRIARADIIMTCFRCGNLEILNMWLTSGKIELKWEISYGGYGYHGDYYSPKTGGSYIIVGPEVLRQIVLDGHINVVKYFMNIDRTIIVKFVSESLDVYALVNRKKYKMVNYLISEGCTFQLWFVTMGEQFRCGVHRSNNNIYTLIRILEKVSQYSNDRGNYRYWSNLWGMVSTCLRLGKTSLSKYSILMESKAVKEICKHIKFSDDDIHLLRIRGLRNFIPQ